VRNTDDIGTLVMNALSVQPADVQGRAGLGGARRHRRGDYEVVRHQP
jgi:hypothetical protein